MTVSDAAGFAVVDLVVGPAAGIAVRGELEIATAPDLTAALDEAIRDHLRPVRHRSRECRLPGLQRHHLPGAGAGAAGRDDRTLALICPPGHTRRVLSLVGMDELVALYDSREEVLDALGSSAEGG